MERGFDDADHIPALRYIDEAYGKKPKKPSLTKKILKNAFYPSRGGKPAHKAKHDYTDWSRAPCPLKTDLLEDRMRGWRRNQVQGAPYGRSVWDGNPEAYEKTRGRGLHRDPPPYEYDERYPPYGRDQHYPPYKRDEQYRPSENHHGYDPQYPEPDHYPDDYYPEPHPNQRPSIGMPPAPPTHLSNHSQAPPIGPSHNPTHYSSAQSRQSRQSRQQQHMPPVHEEQGQYPQEEQAQLDEEARWQEAEALRQQEERLQYGQGQHMPGEYPRQPNARHYSDRERRLTQQNLAQQEALSGRRESEQEQQERFRRPTVTGF